MLLNNYRHYHPNTRMQDFGIIFSRNEVILQVCPTTIYLDASSHLYERVCLSIHPSSHQHILDAFLCRQSLWHSVHRSVYWSTLKLFFFRKCTLRIWWTVSTSWQRWATLGHAVDVANVLPTCCQRVANALPTRCQRVANTLSTHCQHVANAF